MHAIQLTTLITFLPTLLNQLFTLLVSTSSEEIGLNIIRVLINLVNMVYEAGRKDILQAYVKYVFIAPLSKKNITVHEELCKHLPIILHPNNTDFLVVNKFMHHGDFFFDVIVKAMAQHLLSSGRIKVGVLDLKANNVYTYCFHFFFRCTETSDFRPIITRKLKL